MKLTAVHITNFRPVDDSGEFDVRDITCLVGKNEAGKSAALMVLAAAGCPVPARRCLAITDPKRTSGKLWPEPI